MQPGALGGIEQEGWKGEREEEEGMGFASAGSGGPRVLRWAMQSGWSWLKKRLGESGSFTWSTRSEQTQPLFLPDLPTFLFPSESSKSGTRRRAGVTECRGL